MRLRVAKLRSGIYPCWTAQEDEALLARCAVRIPSGEADWRVVAQDFPTRSFVAVRQHYLKLRQDAAGIKPKKRIKIPKVNARKRRRPAGQEIIIPQRPTAEHATLTALLCGDPLPGRSALDEKRSLSR